MLRLGAEEDLEDDSEKEVSEDECIQKADLLNLKCIQEEVALVHLKEVDHIPMLCRFSWYSTSIPWFPSAKFLQENQISWKNDGCPTKLATA